MGRTLSSVIELVVGLACLAGIPSAWRVRRFRWLAVGLLVAGLAAVVHGGLALA